MDTQTGRIQEMDVWEEELGTEELKKRMESGRLVSDRIENLRDMSETIRDRLMEESAERKRKKVERLSTGTKNQRKKARQMQRDSKRKNRKKK